MNVYTGKLCVVVKEINQQTQYRALSFAAVAIVVVVNIILCCSSCSARVARVNGDMKGSL